MHQNAILSSQLYRCICKMNYIMASLIQSTIHTIFCFLSMFVYSNLTQKTCVNYHKIFKHIKILQVVICNAKPCWQFLRVEYKVGAR